MDGFEVARTRRSNAVMVRSLPIDGGRNGSTPAAKHSFQAGVAILTTTVLLLAVALLAVLVVGRAGLWEQQLAGADARSKEVHAAANGGLEYALNRLEQMMRESRALSDPGVFLDPSRWENGFFGAGARLVVNAQSNSDWLPDGMMLAGEESVLYPVAMSADRYEYEWVYTALTPLDAPTVAAPMMIEVAVTARAMGDSHVRKTVGMDVALGFSPLFPWSDTAFYAPPLVVEGCITGALQGQVAILLADGPAVATTQASDGSAPAGCLSSENISGCFPGSPLSGCLVLTPDQTGFVQPAGTLWATIFGDISRSELRAVAERHPDRLLWIDHDGTHPGWDGHQWHQDVATPQNPAILFFDKSVGCPAISGHVQIYGIVYFEDDSCEAHQWSGGALHGTLAIAGDLRDLVGSVSLIAAELDFSGAPEDPRFGWTYRLHYFPVSGSWRDFGF